jgi:4-aminobutyrate aminotransferase-like enzyme
MAAFKVLLESEFDIGAKEELFKSLLVHPKIKAIRSFGLWMAIEFESLDICKKVIDNCIERGVISDWFLFASNCLRISAPLTISNTEIESACRVILDSIQELAR